MKLKKVILSLLMLFAYLSSVGMSVYSVLSCHCVEMRAKSWHVCGEACLEHHDLDAHKIAFSSDCCSGSHHDTEVELYTVSSSSHSDRQIKQVIILTLPYALVSETCACCIFEDVCIYLGDKPVPSYSEFIIPFGGLRAPPVIA